MLQKLRLAPLRISALTRSILASTAAYPANVSTNAANAAEITVCDIVLTAYYQPSVVPTQSASVPANGHLNWTIDTTPPDFQAGDVLEWVPASSYNNGTNVEDALWAVGLSIGMIGVYGGHVIAVVTNGTGAPVATPVGYNPTCFLLRTTQSVKVD
jgi:hypothetical protein